MGQLEDMQIFVKVIDAGGIGLASDQIGLAKSAVSRRLSELETRLGVTLIHRTTRTSKITEEGHNYYIRALQLINEVNELNSLSANPENLIPGSIRLTAPISFGIKHLAPALDSFSKEHPELKFDIDFSNNKIDLIEGGFDLAFRIGALENSSLKARVFSPIRFSICASPEYLKQHGTPKTLCELKEHQSFCFGFTGSNTLKLTDKKEKQHTVQINNTSKMIANNVDFLNDMAIAGHGIVITPNYIAWKAIANGELIPILQDYTLEDIYAYALYPQTRYLSRRVRLLIDFLAERFDDNPYWDQKIR